MTTAVRTLAVTTQLGAWARDVYGPGALIGEVQPMPGHSGHSFGFLLAADGNNERLVIRLPPPGSRGSGSSDVLRQSRVMAVMASHGVPVPPIIHDGDGTRWFDAPYYVAGWVEGRSTSLFREGIDHDENGAGLAPVFRVAMETLAAIHRVDWQAALPGWAEPTTHATEIATWQPTLHKSKNPEWVAAGVALARALSDTAPPDPRPSVTHGDYYSNNWLFDDARITAIVDWEIAGVGAPGLDLGWLAMFYDAECWGPSRHLWEAWRPTIDSLVTDYVRAGGVAEHMDWYRALANYRFACIIARAYELHLAGKHVDPAWEINAEAFPLLLARAHRLLGRD